MVQYVLEWCGRFGVQAEDPTRSYLITLAPISFTISLVWPPVSALSGRTGAVTDDTSYRVRLFEPFMRVVNARGVMFNEVRGKVP